MGAYTISGAVQFNGLPFGKPLYFMSKPFWYVPIELDESANEPCASLSSGIRSKPHSSPLQERCSSMRTTSVSIQVTVQTKSKTICCPGCSKTLPRTPRWSPYNKHISIFLLINVANENKSTNGQCCLSTPPLIALNTKCRIISPIPPLSLSLPVSCCA